MNKNASSTSDVFMNSLSSFMNNQLPSGNIDANLVNMKQELDIEILSLINDATKDMLAVKCLKSQISTRKADDLLKILSNPGTSEAMKGIDEAAIQA
jgi:hypothetical protein